jgi:hypothetical protein
VEDTAKQYSLHLNRDKCVLLRSASAKHTVHYADGTELPPAATAKYLGVILTPDGSCKADIAQRLARARKHFFALHNFWRHTHLSTQWKIRIYKAVFIPLLCYGMESAALTPAEASKLEAFHSQSLRKITNTPSTYYTKVLADPGTATHTNQQVRIKAKQPPLMHHIQHRQLRFFGHILRSSPKSLERNCCFTDLFVYRGGLIGDGLRQGRRREHWVEQQAKLAWLWLDLDERPLPTPQPTFPSAFLTLHRIAADRHFWVTFAGLPTCTQHSANFDFFSYSQ